MPLLIWNRNAAEKTPGHEPRWNEMGLNEMAGASFTPSRGALALQAQTLPWHEETPAAGRRGLFETCANPRCSSGWLHLWRSRSAPVFEGGWTCSPECTRARMEAAVRREMDGRNGAAQARPHRIPLGLLMLEQGWITQSQLRQALEAQKSAHCGRIGEWLARRYAVPEEMVTRALGLQWSCPVLGLDFHDSEGLAVMLPRLFVDAFGALPLRVAARKILYLGFEDRLDPALALAVETMTGLRVESGLVRESAFRPAHAHMLKAEFPSVELVEAVSETALAQAFARAVERARPAASRLVRVHDCLWLRLWLRSQSGPMPEAGAIRDMVGSIGF